MMRKRDRSEHDSVLGISIDGHNLNEEADLSDSTDDDGNIDIEGAHDIPSHVLLTGEMFLDDDSDFHDSSADNLASSPSSTKKKAKSRKYKKSCHHMGPNCNYNLITDRLIGTMHMPLQTPKIGKDKRDTRSKCGICNAKTTILCSHCLVGLCIADRGDTNCWREFHTKEFIEFSRPKHPLSRYMNQKMVERSHSSERNRLLPVDAIDDMIGPSSSMPFLSPDPDPDDPMGSVII